jgi:hypothetical protein
MAIFRSIVAHPRRRWGGAREIEATPIAVRAPRLDGVG